MTALYWLVRKDVQRFLADRRGALLTVMMPVVLGALLGSLFGPRERRSTLDLLVVDGAGTPESKRLVGRIVKNGAFSVREEGADVARSAVERGDSPAAFVIAPDAHLGIGVMSGGATGLTLWVDPSRTAEAEMAAGVLQGIVYQGVADAFTNPAERPSLAAGLAAALTLAATPKPLETADTVVGILQGRVGDKKEPSSGASLLAIRTEAVTVSAPAAGGATGYNSYAHNFAGMLCMFLLFFAIEQAKERIGERATGLEARLRMAPVTARGLRAAQGLSAAIMALVISGIVYAVAMLAFGVEVRGSLTGFGLVLVGQAAFVAGFTLLLTGLGSSERESANIGSFFTLVASFLGGAWLPSFLLPDWVQSVGYALPTYWSTHGLAAMTWRGLGVEAALLPAGMLVLLGGACAAIGLLRR